jgi:hypothetical protein
MKTIQRLLLAFVIVLLFGCATTSTSVQTNNIQAEGIKPYRRVFIEPLKEDEFQVASALTVELSDMGFELSGKPFQYPIDTDLNVRVSVDGGWDFKRYLQSLQLQFVAAKSGRIVATTSFYSYGVWLGVRDRRLRLVFNDLRSKQGFPPSKQFPE